VACPNFSLAAFYCCVSGILWASGVGCFPFTPLMLLCSSMFILVVWTESRTINTLLYFVNTCPGFFHITRRQECTQTSISGVDYGPATSVSLTPTVNHCVLSVHWDLCRDAQKYVLTANFNVLLHIWGFLRYATIIDGPTFNCRATM
jgi:hypothetical protein